VPVELVKVGDLVRLDQDHDGKTLINERMRILGLCVGISKDKKRWRRRAKILWLGSGRVSSILIMRLKTAHQGYNNIEA